MRRSAALPATDADAAPRGAPRADSATLRKLLREGTPTGDQGEQTFRAVLTPTTPAT